MSAGARGRIRASRQRVIEARRGQLRRDRAPRILITLDTGEALRRGVPFPTVHTKAAYVRAVEAAGGVPVLVAPTGDEGVRRALLALMDGLVVTGGDFDIDPARYGRGAPPKRLDVPKPLRTDFEWFLLEEALARRCPVLGICGGMQLLNVVLGGTLIGDLASEVPGALEHEQPTSPAAPDHPVHLTATCPLVPRLGTVLRVNTTHHQAVADPGRGVEVWGRAPDGVIELIGLAGRPEVVGAQWHPELLDDAASRVLYGDLVTRSRAGRPRGMGER